MNRKWRKRESGCGGEVGREKTESNRGRQRVGNVCHMPRKKKKKTAERKEMQTEVKHYNIGRGRGNQRHGKGKREMTLLLLGFPRSTLMSGIGGRTNLYMQRK